MVSRNGTPDHLRHRSPDQQHHHETNINPDTPEAGANADCNADIDADANTHTDAESSSLAFSALRFSVRLHPETQSQEIPNQDDDDDSKTQAQDNDNDGQDENSKCGPVQTISIYFHDGYRASHETLCIHLTPRRNAKATFQYPARDLLQPPRPPHYFVEQDDVVNLFPDKQGHNHPLHRPRPLLHRWADQCLALTPHRRLLLLLLTQVLYTLLVHFYLATLIELWEAVSNSNHLSISGAVNANIVIYPAPLQLPQIVSRLMECHSTVAEPLLLGAPAALGRHFRTAAVSPAIFLANLSRETLLLCNLLKPLSADRMRVHETCMQAYLVVSGQQEAWETAVAIFAHAWFHSAETALDSLTRITRLLRAKNHSTTTTITGMTDHGSGGSGSSASDAASSSSNHYQQHRDVGGVPTFHNQTTAEILDMFSNRLLRETPDSFVDIIHKASMQLQRVQLSDTQAAIRGILDLARALGVAPSASAGDYGTGAGNSTPLFSHQPANDDSAPDDDLARDNALLRFRAEQRASQVAGMVEGLDVLREPVFDTQSRLQDTITQLELLTAMIRNMANTPLPSSLPFSSSSSTSTSPATAAPHNQSTLACLWFHIRDMVISSNDNEEAPDQHLPWWKGSPWVADSVVGHETIRTCFYVPGLDGLSAAFNGQLTAYTRVAKDTLQAYSDAQNRAAKQVVSQSAPRGNEQAV